MFDQRLRTIILKIVDVSYGGDNGFNQAIELSAEVLTNVKFVQEKKLISTFFEEISQDTGKYCFGVEDTLRALDIGAVHTLIVWENLDVTRYQIKNPVAGGRLFDHLKDLSNSGYREGYHHLLDKRGREGYHKFQRRGWR